MGSHSGLGSEEIELQPVGDDELPKDARSAFRRKLGVVSAAVDAMDNAVNKSSFGRTFRLRGCGHVSISLMRASFEQTY